MPKSSGAIFQQQPGNPCQPQQDCCFQRHLDKEREKGCRHIHGYRPSCWAFLINCERYCRSLAESFVSESSSRAATACSGEPPKKVLTMCLSAEARTWRGLWLGRYTYLSPRCSWRKWPLSSSR